MCYIRSCQRQEPVILSLIPEYSKSYISLYEQGTLPKPLTDYYDERYLKLPFSDLLEQCEKFFNELEITGEQAKKLN